MEKRKIVYTVAALGDHVYISCDGRLMSVNAAEKIRSDAEKESEDGFFRKYGITREMFPTASVGTEDKKKIGENALGMFRGLCRDRRERGEPCYSPSDRCPLLSSCNADKCFFFDADGIEVR